MCLGTLSEAAFKNTTGFPFVSLMLWDFHIISLFLFPDFPLLSFLLLPSFFNFLVSFPQFFLSSFLSIGSLQDVETTLNMC